MSKIVTFSGASDNSDFNLASEISIDSLGKATLTITAVSHLVGVSQPTLSTHFNYSKKPSKLAEMLIQQGFDPHSFFKGVPDTAVSIITTYYAMLAGDRCTDVAKKAAMVFMSIGVRSYAQEIKGWTKPSFSLKQEITKYLPTTPSKWEKRFGDDFWFQLHECYGLKRGQIACASFIRAYIYGWFPVEVQERLDEINPLIKSENEPLSLAKRRDRNHQYFQDELLNLLVYHINRITDLLRTSRNKEDFRVRVTALDKYTFQPVDQRLPE